VSCKVEFIRPILKSNAALQELKDTRELVARQVMPVEAMQLKQGADVFWLLRRIEIQSESLLNYVYNPFRG
jgi:hypothetical protein